jgi:hypothetical protein
MSSTTLKRTRWSNSESNKGVECESVDEGKTIHTLEGGWIYSLLFWVEQAVGEGGARASHNNLLGDDDDDVVDGVELLPRSIDNNNELPTDEGLLAVISSNTPVCRRVWCWGVKRY